MGSSTPWFNRPPKFLRPLINTYLKKEFGANKDYFLLSFLCISLWLQLFQSILNILFKRMFKKEMKNQNVLLWDCQIRTIHYHNSAFQCSFLPNVIENDTFKNHTTIVKTTSFTKKIIKKTIMSCTQLYFDPWA